MKKKYIVRLVDEEREQLVGIVRKLAGGSERVKRAQILLKADADGPGYTPLHWAVGAWDTDLTGPSSVKPPKDHEWNRNRGDRN